MKRSPSGKQIELDRCKTSPPGDLLSYGEFHAAYLRLGTIFVFALLFSTQSIIDSLQEPTLALSFWQLQSGL